MTLLQLEQKLAELRNLGKANDRTQVFIYQTNDEYPNSLLENAEVKTLSFSLDDLEEFAEEDCVVLTDEI